MLIGFCLTVQKFIKYYRETGYLRDLFTDGLIKNQFSYLMELDKFIILLIIILFPFDFFVVLLVLMNYTEIDLNSVLP